MIIVAYLLNHHVLDEASWTTECMAKISICPRHGAETGGLLLLADELCFGVLGFCDKICFCFLDGCICFYFYAISRSFSCLSLGKILGICGDLLLILLNVGGLFFGFIFCNSRNLNRVCMSVSGLFRELAILSNENETVEH